MANHLCISLSVRGTHASYRAAPCGWRYILIFNWDDAFGGVVTEAESLEDGGKSISHPLRYTCRVYPTRKVHVRAVERGGFNNNSDGIFIVVCSSDLYALYGSLNRMQVPRFLEIQAHKTGRLNINVHTL